MGQYECGEVRFFPPLSPPLIPSPLPPPPLPSINPVCIYIYTVTGGSCVQTICVPAISVWCVCVMSNGQDIACGSRYVYRYNNINNKYCTCTYIS